MITNTPHDKSAAAGLVGTSALLADLFAASAELRFHIKSLNLARVEQNQSWHRHTEVMRRVEAALKSANDKVSDGGTLTHELKQDANPPFAAPLG